MKYNEPAEFLSGYELEYLAGYRHGVDRVIEYVASIHAHPRLVAELKWAIEEGII